MNDKLITLYEQLEQLSSDLQVMMTRVSDMQQVLALLTKEWLERTAPDVIEETSAVPVYEAAPEQNSEMAEYVDTHEDIAEPCIAVEPEEAMPDSADEILTEDTGEAEEVEDVDDQVDEMTADAPVEFEDDIEVVEMDDDMSDATDDQVDEIGMDEDTEDVIEDNDDPDVPFDFDDRFDQDVDDTEQDEDENESEDQIPDRENVAGLPELRRLFTLNDKYRFRRELFGNDNAAMTDTVNMLEAMTSLAEAEDYLYNDMGWDAESDEVKEFIAVVKRRFNAKI